MFKNIGRIRIINLLMLTVAGMVNAFGLKAFSYFIIKYTKYAA